MCLFDEKNKKNVLSLFGTIIFRYFSFGLQKPIPSFSLAQRKETFSPLFLWRREKRQKRHPPTPIPSLYGGAQPLLLVARSLRYAQGIKALA